MAEGTGQDSDVTLAALLGRGRPTRRSPEEGRDNRAPRERLTPQQTLARQGGGARSLTPGHGAMAGARGAGSQAPALLSSVTGPAPEGRGGQLAGAARSPEGPPV